MRTTVDGWASYDVDDVRALRGRETALYVAMYALARTRYLRSHPLGELRPGLIVSELVAAGMSSSTLTRALRAIDASDRWVVWRTIDGKVLGVELAAVAIDGDRPPGAVAHSILTGRQSWRARSSEMTTDTSSLGMIGEREEAGAVVESGDRGPGPTRGAEVVRQLRARTRRKSEATEATPEAPPAAALG